MKFSPVSCKHNAIIEVKGDNHTLFKIWMHVTALEDQEKDEDDNSGEISTGIMIKMSKKQQKTWSILSMWLKWHVKNCCGLFIKLYMVIFFVI